MHPVFFRLGSIVGYSYGLMIGIGALLAIFVSQWRAKRRGLDGDLVFSAAVWGLFAGLLGAKLTFIASNIKLLFSDPGSVLGADGFTVYGGVVLGILVGGLIVRHAKVDVPLYLDLVIPQIALAQCFGRIGCFLAGCCYGRPTHSHFGVVFPPEAIAPSGIPLIPTQLISAAGDFLIFIILILLSNFATDYLKVGKAKSGADLLDQNVASPKKSFLQPPAISGMYLILYGIGRFVIEFLRADPRKTALGLTSNQFVSIVFLIVGIALIAYGFKRAKNKASGETPASEVPKEGCLEEEA
ncbi:MAG: prolipoprotein diacylglyceryl transferase [Clostridia bacterium]|nr:prolipoprotein diacylglyceryl transferase [Clostridia bacterium]